MPRENQAQFLRKSDYTTSTQKKGFFFMKFGHIRAEVDSGHQKVNGLASSSASGFLYYFVLPHSKFNSSWRKKPQAIIFIALSHVN